MTDRRALGNRPQAPFAVSARPRYTRPRMEQLSTSEQALIGRIDPEPMLAATRRWSAINTGTGNLPGLADQAALLADALSALPGTVTCEEGAQAQAIAPDGTAHPVGHGRHLVLRVRPDATRRVLLTGHMDTVFPPDHPFQTCGWIGDGILGGPGVADMKGGIAVLLAALSAFEGDAVALQMGYDVLLNADEEAGSPSSAPLIAALAQGKRAALTYEPSALPDGTLAGERPGSGNWSIVITGRSAHAGRNPQDGRNAIVAAAALVLGLKGLERDGLTVNPARIDGGSAVNVVPDRAVVRFNARAWNAPAFEDFLHSLNSLIAEVSQRHEVAIHLHGAVGRPPKPLDPASLALFELVRRCGAALGQTVAWQRTGGVCDGNNIAACGVPVVDTLGVRGGAIHSPDEYLIVSSLAERAALSALLLRRLAMGEGP